MARHIQNTDRAPRRRAALARDHPCWAGGGGGHASPPAGTIRFEQPLPPPPLRRPALPPTSLQPPPPGGSGSGVPPARLLLARCRLAQPGRTRRAPTPRGHCHCRRRHRRPRTAGLCDLAHPPRRPPATRLSGAGKVPSMVGVACGPAAADDAKLLSAAPPAAVPPRRPLRGRQLRGCAVAEADEAPPPPPPVEPVAKRPLGSGSQAPAGRTAAAVARRARWRGHRRGGSGGGHEAGGGGCEGRRDGCERGWRWGRGPLRKRPVRYPRQWERMYVLSGWSFAVLVGCLRRVGITPKFAPRHATW